MVYRHPEGRGKAPCAEVGGETPKRLGVEAQRFNSATAWMARQGCPNSALACPTLGWRQPPPSPAPGGAGLRKGKRAAARAPAAGSGLCGTEAAPGGGSHSRPAPGVSGAFHLHGARRSPDLASSPRDGGSEHKIF